MTQNNDTIAAVATPQGSGGLGVVRISGKDAFSVADKVFRAKTGKKISEIPGYTALYGKVFRNDEPLDEAVALVFRAPKSYTGEDVVELSVHGGNYLVRETLRAVLNAGARVAFGGEFTRRAYENGKMDLMEAEAVMNLISADGEKARRAALSLHEGAASAEVQKIRSALLTAAAGLAVFSDYPDDELPEFSEETLKGALNEAEKGLSALLKNYDAGKVLREGVDTVIAGRPNVGKSTLMNLLSGCRRSIVTAIAGTTRDVVEDIVRLGDITLRLSDTAGLRSTPDEIERLGVEISREKIQSATLLLAVFDLSRPADEEDLALLNECRQRPSVVIYNKSDLSPRFDTSLGDGLYSITVCAEDKGSLALLEKAVATVCGTENLSGSETFLCSERQHDCCRRAMDYVKEAERLLKSGYTLDTVGVCLDDAIGELLSLTGERVQNAVVDEVFRKFCVGK